jgi:trans-2,3-dihydro-3-hydroxyanthranilate isomerase
MKNNPLVMLTMKKIPYHIVDVFAEEKYAGNQLAVVRDAKAIPDKMKQHIAREMNFSETTFILSDVKQDGGYNVRIFTPANELSFAGHPTLGTAYIIQREIIRKEVKEIILNLKVGQIHVSLSYAGKEPDTLWMHQLPPVFGHTFEKNMVCQVLGIDADEIDSRVPIEEVSTGMPFLIVPLRNLQTLKKARIVREKYLELINRIEAKSILVFCRETYKSGNDLSVRVFVDYYGIPEDPATGGGNGCLAGYLVKHLYFGKPNINIRVEQGYEIGRPSLLLLKAEGMGERIEVHVGGKVINVAKGELF